ncbi:MAG TPA: PRC-barrel domain-containing protein [Longimicrobiales bacterium]|nr:PRC-barrel domain-containing protein [Longimicrobiales bacterium]
MLRSIDAIRGYVLETTEGDIGRCKDFLFNDEDWVIRYMVADTGKWLPGRKVLISPISLGEPQWDSRRFPVMLSKEQIEHAPGLGRDAPVSRQHEAEMFTRWGYSPYWRGAGAWGDFATPGLLRGEEEESGDLAVAIEQRGDPKLRSADEVMGYAIQAEDDEVGHVEDFIVDDANWAIRYMIVDTRNWLPGRQVLVSPHWVHGFDWSRRSATVDLTRRQIEASPEYVPGAPVNRSYEKVLYDYYGRPRYWA